MSFHNKQHHIKHLHCQLVTQLSSQSDMSRQDVATPPSVLQQEVCCHGYPQQLFNWQL